jgi:putative oxidoreductase
MNLSCLCAINTRMQSCVLPFINLLFRIIVAYPFFISGLTKWQYIKNDQLDTLYFLFEDYNVPFLSVEYAAILATFGELILPILLVFGFMTRFAAFGLLVMTALIYNADANPHAIYWAAILLYLCINGAGKISLDSLIAKKWLL